MTSNNPNYYTRHNLSGSKSDIQVLVEQFKDRIEKEIAVTESNAPTPFLSFAEQNFLAEGDEAWLHDNNERFFVNTSNEPVARLTFATKMGFICSLEYSPDGENIVVGYSTGMIQMRHGKTGVVLCTLRNIQFPPKPVHSIKYSRKEEGVCYAACTDGAVYRIEIPITETPVDEPSQYCIRADPALEYLNTQYFGNTGIESQATPFIKQRTPAHAMGISADSTKMIVGYADTSIKVYDMETQQAEITYKVHKLRLQFIPKKLQRMHTGQVCALAAHEQKPFVFASGGWDNTLRIWDVRCKVGCMMTFEGVTICHDSLDLCRDLCITGSWQPTEALSMWDIVAKKRLHVVRIQNRRPNVDGEYIYACRFWNSQSYNRKGKYGIIGGSGTRCMEVINLHNRYITCSFPAPGSVLAVASHDDRIAFGGTAAVFNIVSFHDPKHEKIELEIEPSIDFSKLQSMWPESPSRTMLLESTLMADTVKSGDDTFDYDSDLYGDLY